MQPIWRTWGSNRRHLCDWLCPNVAQPVGCAARLSSRHLLCHPTDCRSTEQLSHIHGRLCCAYCTWWLRRAGSEDFIQPARRGGRWTRRSRFCCRFLEWSRDTLLFAYGCNLRDPVSSSCISNMLGRGIFEHHQAKGICWGPLSPMLNLISLIGV